MASLEIDRKVVLMKKKLILLALFFTLSVNVYADDIDPEYIKNNNVEEENIWDNYKNETFLIFSSVLLMLIIIAAISIRKSVKGDENDNANG